MDESNMNGELEALLRQSPFGVLLDIPGIELDDILSGFGASTGGGGPSFGGTGSGASNPFANFNPLEDGNPFVEGDEPNVDFGSGSFSGSVYPLH